jgi:hypothetical protein
MNRFVFQGLRIGRDCLYPIQLITTANVVGCNPNAGRSMVGLKSGDDDFFNISKLAEVRAVHFCHGAAIIHRKTIRD